MADGPLQTEATEPAEEFLRAVGGEQTSDDETEQEQALLASSRLLRRSGVPASGLPTG
jgi:hypothetical protein